MKKFIKLLNQKKAIILKFSAFTIIGMVFLFSFGQGCNANVMQIKNNASLASNGIGLESPLLQNVEIVSSTQKTVSVVYGKQILEHFANCLGVALPSDRTIAVYEAKKGSLSEYGSASTVTAPMLMAVVSIAGEICEDLITRQENTNLRIFQGFNFASQSLPASVDLQNAVRRIARSCWSRNEDATELGIIMTQLNSSLPGTAANRQHDAALFMCTTMLSSLEAIML